MKVGALWIAAVAVAAVLLVASGYRSRDPDSALYAKLSAYLASEPVERWIAPEWKGEWQTQGLFREHPIGILVVPATAIRLGVPSEQAAYIVNMLYQVAVILLIPAVAALIATGLEARTLAWTLQFLPVAFAYRIRANQEHPVLMASLVLLYATQRARERPIWVPLMIAAFCFIVMIKGAFAMFALVAAALWLILIPAPEQGRDRWAWLGLVLTFAAAVLLVLGYEAVYERTTGESFLEFYRSNRLGVSMRLTGSGLVWHSLRNVAFYLVRILWFAAPWSLVVVAAVWLWMRSRIAGTTPALFTQTSERVLCWTLAITAVYIVVLSPALVRAERFVFPTYFIIGAVGVIVAMRTSPRLREIATRADRYVWLPVAIWFGGILTRVLPYWF
jgi:4-amino-4-deoxy-L-arabinose transferase-like glycosyltransferase